MGGTGCCSAQAADHPARHDTRRRQRLQLAYHLSCCFRSRTGQHRLLLGAHAADRPDGRGAYAALAATSDFSSLYFLAAGFPFGMDGAQAAARRKQLITLPGQDARHNQRLQLAYHPAFVLGLSSTGCCLARTQLIAQTGAMLT